MNRQQKTDEVDEITRLLDGAQLVVLTEYAGLDVASMVELRSSLRKADTAYRVLKNSLAKRATVETDLEQLNPHFKGPIGVVVSKEDPAAAAKALMDFAKSHDALKITAGILAGKVLDASAIDALSKLPSKDGLRAMLLGAMQGVPRNMVTVLAAVPRDFVGVLAARQRSLEEAA